MSTVSVLPVSVAPVGPGVELSALKYVYVELTVKCNLKCHFCDNAMRNLYRDMPGDRFREIVSQLQPGTKLALHGLGEPTLHRGLVDLIAFAKTRGLYVYFNTNFTVATDDQMRGFVEHQLDELRISMSAGSREAFESYSGRDLHDQLLARARRMVAIRGSSAKPLLRAVFVLTRQSYSEFPAVIRHVEDIGFDELQVQTFLNWGKPRGPEEPTDGCAIDERERLAIRATMTAAAKSATRVRIILPFPPDGTDADVEETLQPGRCQWPFDAIWITADGHVTPCCNLHDPRQLTLGTVFGRPVGEVWLGPQYESFREKYRRNEVDACQTCPINYGQFKSYTYG
ncbi:MAG: hypothetical protein DMF87_21130 [Acidobacteria bacterium]|nr:MAG: hypothetical protein DMF87_21130 [Acidobacteriota bacterium]